MRCILKVFLLAFLCFSASAQEAVKVGESVEYKCPCADNQWLKVKVDAVRGDTVRVRWGNLDNQAANVSMSSGLIRLLPKPEDPSVQAMRSAFDSAARKYLGSVMGFAHFYDPQFTKQPGPLRPNEWQKTMGELAELDGLCKGQFRGVADMPSYYHFAGNVDNRYPTWCKIAAARLQLEPLVRLDVANSTVSMGYTTENLNTGNQPNTPLHLEVQEMIWNRDKWRASKMPKLKAHYAALGVMTVPADALAKYEKQADDLWKLAEAGAPNRSYKMPPWRDAAVEAFVKRRLAARIPGVQFVKIGLEYRTWVKRESHSMVGSDDYFNYYKVTYNSYKRGTMLIKIPGRPFCQEQDFVVGQSGKGIVDAGIGGVGVFMRCE